MNHRRIFSGLIAGAAGCAATISMAAGGGEFTPAEDQALVLREFDRLRVETPVAPDFAAMNVRVFGPGGELLMSFRSYGEPVEFLMTSGLPDGEYRYEAVSIFTTDDLRTKDRSGQYSDEATLERSYGKFRVFSGEIVDPAHPGDQNHPIPREDASLLDRVLERAVRVAGATLDFLVPAAQAADTTITDTTPSLLFDDTQDEDCTPSWDWSIDAEGGTSDGDTGNSMIFASWTESCAIFGSSVPIITLNHDGGAGSFDSIDTLVVDADGDLHFAQDRLYFDKSTTELSIGTTSTPGDLNIYSGNPEIYLHDESFADAMRIEYDGVEFNIVNTLGADSFSVDYEAPGGTMFLDLVGNVGIGTTSPAQAVDVVRSAAASRFQLTSYTNTGNEAPQFIQRRARGTSGAPLATAVNDNLGLISFRGYTGTLFSGSQAAIAARAAETWSAGARGTRLLFNTTPNGSTTMATVMEITQDAKVKINGTELSVPDYVFEEDYPLMPLDDLSAYITEHRHLPGVASAEEVNTNGLDLGGSQMSMLEKIEELTLYTLQQHEELRSLRAENAELRSAYGSLQAGMARVEQLEQAVDLLMRDRSGDALLTAVNR